MAGLGGRGNTGRGSKSLSYRGTRLQKRPYLFLCIYYYEFYVYGTTVNLKNALNTHTVSPNRPSFKQPDWAEQEWCLVPFQVVEEHLMTMLWNTFVKVCVFLCTERECYTRAWPVIIKEEQKYNFRVSVNSRKETEAKVTTGKKQGTPRDQVLYRDAVGLRQCCQGDQAKGVPVCSYLYCSPPRDACLFLRQNKDILVYNRLIRKQLPFREVDVLS